MDAFIGEIRMFAGDYPPAGWSFCDGRAMTIQGYELLFSLIGTTYGGDGRTYFHLPDLRGRAPVHVGTVQNTTFRLGVGGGQERVELAASQMPRHRHGLVISDAQAQRTSPLNVVLADSRPMQLYNDQPPDVDLSSSSIGPSGQSQAHENMQPFLVINYIIATEGYLPPRP